MTGRIVPGVRLHDVAGDTLEEKVQNAAELGFKCVHLASKLLCKSWDTDIFGLTDERAKHLKDLFAKEGLTVTVFGCYKNLLEPDLEKREGILRQYEASGRFARVLGASVVGTECGRPDPKNQITEARTTDEALHELAREVKRAAALVEDEGSRLAIEPGWNEAASTPERARKVLDEAGDPAVSDILDPVSLLHPTMLEDAAVQSERELALLGERISVLHAKDFRVVGNEEKAGWCDGSGSRLECYGAGVTGSFDYAPFVRWAKGTGRSIPCIVENGTPETFKTSLAYLARLQETA